MRPKSWIAPIVLAATCLVALAIPGWAGAAKRVAAAGDIACAPSSPAFNLGLGTDADCRQVHTSKLIAGAGHHAVLTLGDAQYPDGSLASFLRSYAASWGRFKARTRPAIGNHEYGYLDGAGYFDYFNGIARRSGRAGSRGRGYYSFDLGRWHLIALDSNCDRIDCAAGSDQERWLRRDLARNPTQCTLAYWHHPRFSSGFHGSDERLSSIWRTLQRSRVELALAEHDHDYERFAPKRANGRVSERRGVRQFVVGTGGKELREFGEIEGGSRKRIAGAFGVLELRLARGAYEWAFKAEPDGRVLDRGSASCRG